MSHIISIELDISSYGIVKDTPWWIGADSVLAEVPVEGSFDDLLESAWVSFSDQDGGEAKPTPFDGSYMSDVQFESITEELRQRWMTEKQKLIK